MPEVIDRAEVIESIVNVHHPRFYSRILFSGGSGAAEACMAGLWSADGLTMAMALCPHAEGMAFTFFREYQ
jgi:hypothetical protein